MATMRLTAKYLAGAAGVVLCSVAVLASRHRAPVAASVQTAPVVQVQGAPASPAPPSPDALDQPVALTVSEEANFIPPLPADATAVPDADLLKLSVMVDLTNADERHIDKERWSRAVPVAERLAQGPCDCEQRNWLTQFIRMGNDALTGSEEDYYRLVEVMRKTPRNDKQLQANAAFFNR